ncbi:MAG: crotonobetainyl-CoA:carnitine CoA-transferase CaiB-like acyl-CoA transferase [Candidatus Azotimanducaceae bacterium]|jgi:crotonobetainyl-CoA:carnitine CoA-transferase CaiB-like acyl-CoA transferase
MNSPKHLEGLKVLDFSAVYAGPICARFLSDCGASVIKVETPEGGDITRGPEGISRVFAHFNAGKQSVAIDLKKASGQALAHKLIADADVVIENFRPGVMAGFGLDYDSVKDARPDLVYCSISGFGQTGPYVHRAAYAPIAHAASGFDIAHTQSQGDAEGRPAIWGIMVADMLTGSYAYGAIQSALLGRERTGQGEYIDVTMMESMMMLIPGQVQMAQIDSPPLPGGFHPIKVSDGFVMVCVVSEKNMRGLCTAMNRPDMLEDERFSRINRMPNIKQLVAEIETWSNALSAQECETRLNETGVPCSLYNRIGDLFDHPQMLERGSFKTLEDKIGPFMIQNMPFQFRNIDASTSTEVPLLGEQTEAVLQQVLNLSKAEIDKLRTEGAIP